MNLPLIVLANSGHIQHYCNKAEIFFAVQGDFVLTRGLGMESKLDLPYFLRHQALVWFFILKSRICLSFSNFLKELCYVILIL